MRPKGPWQRQAAALADSNGHFSAFKLYLVSNYKESYRGSPISFPQTMEKETTHKKKRKNILTFCMPRPVSSTSVRAQTLLDLHPLHPSPGHPKSRPREGPWPPRSSWARLLWLRVESRHGCIDRCGNIIAIGTPSGRVMVLQFDPQALPVGKLQDYN